MQSYRGVVLVKKKGWDIVALSGEHQLKINQTVFKDCNKDNFNWKRQKKRSSTTDIIYTKLKGGWYSAILQQDVVVDQTSKKR